MNSDAKKELAAKQFENETKRLSRKQERRDKSVSFNVTDAPNAQSLQRRTQIKQDSHINSLPRRRLHSLSTPELNAESLWEDEGDDDTDEATSFSISSSSSSTLLSLTLTKDNNNGDDKSSSSSLSSSSPLPPSTPLLLLNSLSWLPNAVQEERNQSASNHHRQLKCQRSSPQKTQQQQKTVLQKQQTIGGASSLTLKTATISSSNSNSMPTSRSQPLSGSCTSKKPAADHHLQCDTSACSSSSKTNDNVFSPITPYSHQSRFLSEESNVNDNTANLPKQQQRQVTAAAQPQQQQQQQRQRVVLVPQEFSRAGETLSAAARRRAFQPSAALLAKVQNLNAKSAAAQDNVIIKTATANRRNSGLPPIPASLLQLAAQQKQQKQPKPSQTPPHHQPQQQQQRIVTVTPDDCIVCQRMKRQSRSVSNNTNLASISSPDRTPTKSSTRPTFTTQPSRAKSPILRHQQPAIEKERPKTANPAKKSSEPTNLSAKPPSAHSAPFTHAPASAATPQPAVAAENCSERFCTQCNLCQQEAANAAVLTDAQTRLEKLQVEIELLNKQIRLISLAATTAAAAAAAAANNSTLPRHMHNQMLSAASAPSTSSSSTLPKSGSRNHSNKESLLSNNTSSLLVGETVAAGGAVIPSSASASTLNNNNNSSSNSTSGRRRSTPQALPSSSATRMADNNAAPSAAQVKKPPRLYTTSSNVDVESLTTSVTTPNDEFNNLDATTQTSETIDVSSTIDAMLYEQQQRATRLDENPLPAEETDFNYSSIDCDDVKNNLNGIDGALYRAELQDIDSIISAFTCKKQHHHHQHSDTTPLLLELKRHNIQQLMNIMRLLYDKISSKAVRATQMVRMSDNRAENAKIMVDEVLAILDDSFDDAETAANVEQLKAILALPDISALFYCHDVVADQIVHRPLESLSPKHGTLAAQSATTSDVQPAPSMHLIGNNIVGAHQHQPQTMVDVHLQSSNNNFSAPPPSTSTFSHTSTTAVVTGQPHLSTTPISNDHYISQPQQIPGIVNGGNNIDLNLSNSSSSNNYATIVPPSLNNDGALLTNNVAGGRVHGDDDSRFATIRSQGRHGQFHRSMDNLASVPPEDIDALASGLEPHGHHHRHNHNHQNHSQQNSLNRQQQQQQQSRAAGGGGLRIVQLTRNTDEPMGITLRMLPPSAAGSTETKCIVARILHGGLIHRADVLRVGDEIREINAIKITKQNIEAMQKMLREARGNVSFKIVPVQASSALAASSPPVVPPETYVRAQFTYDPQHDDLIPCADAGLAFNTGDILQVIDREDPDWWQARKIGPLPPPPPESEDATSDNNNNNNQNGGSEEKRQQALAAQQQRQHFAITGLIPSPELIEYQQKRLVLEKAGKLKHIDGDDGNVHCSILRRHNNNTSGTAKSANNSSDSKKLRKNQQQSATSGTNGSDAQPKRLWETLAASLLPDQFEVLSYEEVIRLPFYERKTLVLLGAHGVGRRHIKNCLITTHPEKFAYPIPHTTRTPRREEINGRNYHFVTQKEMMSDIAHNEYLEYGTHEGNMYGTKLESIRTIHRQLKIAVLDVEPQALKILRCQEYAPFVVFIAAPTLTGIQDRDGSLQRLQRESDLLRKIYGHLFDMTIINNDIDQTIQILDMAMHDIHQRSQWVPMQWIY